MSLPYAVPMPLAYDQISEAALNFALGFDVAERCEALVDEFGLLEEMLVPLLKLPAAILTKEISLEDLPAAVAKIGELDPVSAKEFAIQFAGQTLLPIAPAIGDVEGAIRSWGGDPAEFADIERVDLPEYSPEGFVHTAIENFGAAIENDLERDRLEFLLVSYARRIRSREEALQSLMRAKKVGGLEWAVDESERVLAAFEEELKKAPPDLFRASIKPPVPQPKPRPLPVVAPVEVVSEPFVPVPEIVVPPPVVEAPIMVPAKVVLPVRPSAEQELTDLLEPSDRAEMAVHAQKTERVVAEATPVLNRVPKIIADLVETTGIKDEEARKRLERIIDARLRDVRDAYGTRAELEKPVKAGGPGLSGRALVELIERIEKTVDARKNETDERAHQEKTEMIEQHLSRDEAENVVRAKEEQLLARRYAELTGKAPTEPIGALAIRTSVAMSADQSVARAAARLDTGKVQRAVEAAQPPKPVPSGARPHMNDVTPPRRLTGPVDELRSLTLTEFRRLSRDAQSATTKVIDKVDLLGEQGYDQRVAGVRAWRESPLNRWYTSCVREALSRGVGVPLLLEEKRKAGEEVPTEAEVAAILTLNGQLRF